jgi:hypothetical protein
MRRESEDSLNLSDDSIVSEPKHTPIIKSAPQINIIEDVIQIAPKVVKSPGKSKKKKKKKKKVELPIPVPVRVPTPIIPPPNIEEELNYQQP